MAIKTEGEDLRELERLLGSSHPQRGILSETESTFPATGKHTVLVDIARILDVDASTGTLKVSCLNLNISPSSVQWCSPLFDARTGDGLYALPKPGSFGLYFSVGGSDYFWGMFGVAESFGQNMFLNYREPLPGGGVALRTSAETKQVWSPNLILIQAAHFCKIALKRVNKLLDILFYSLNLTSLGGSIKWVTDITKGISTFYLTIRNLLPPSRDAAGKQLRSDDARELKIKLGADNVDDKTVGKITLAKVTAKGEKNELESEAVARFRKIVRDFLKGRGVSSPQSIYSNSSLNAAFGDFVLGSDTTLDLIVESIVGAATFVRQARPDGINGRIELSPSVDTVENLSSGDLTPLGARAVTSLATDTEYFVESNRLEIRRDKVTGQTYSTVASSLVQIARAGYTTDDGISSPDERFRVHLSKEGRIVIQQKVPETSSETIEQVGDTSTIGDTWWDLKGLFRLASENGPMDFDAGKGFRLQVAGGVAIVGNGVAGITISSGGDVAIRGRTVTMISYGEQGGWLEPMLVPVRPPELHLMIQLSVNNESLVARALTSWYSDLLGWGRNWGVPMSISAPPAWNRADSWYKPGMGYDDGFLLASGAYYMQVKNYLARYVPYLEIWYQQAINLAHQRNAVIVQRNALKEAKAGTPSAVPSSDASVNVTGTIQLSALGVYVTSPTNVVLQGGQAIMESGFSITPPKSTPQKLRDETLSVLGAPEFKVIDSLVKK